MMFLERNNLFCCFLYCAFLMWKIEFNKRKIHFFLKKVEKNFAVKKYVSTFVAK